MRATLCQERHPSGARCHREPGHEGAHLTYDKQGRESVWLSITVPPKEEA